MKLQSSHIIKAKPWKKNYSPKRILAIRLQAIGDTVITLPYLNYLKNNLPANTRLDFVTREEAESIPKNLYLFDNVYSIAGGRNLKKQFLYAGLLLPQLLLNNYDVVIDLQNNEVSNFVRKMLFPRAWSSFDRFSLLPAGERARLTIEAAGLGKCLINPDFKIRQTENAINLLVNNGWIGNELVILNPAGAFENRNWPIDNYSQFAGLWLKQFPATQFLIIGTAFIEEKASYLKQKLGRHLINLVDKTTAAEAFTIIQKATLVLSEDSGLMHMAWVSGIATIAIFGSTRSDWAQPLGKQAFFFDSADLECGSCMQEICKYGDNHCITRVNAEIVFKQAMVIKTNFKR